MHPYTQTLLAAIPDVSLDKRLDFERAGATKRPRNQMPGRARSGSDANTPQALHDIGDGHFVLAAADAGVRELHA